MPAASPLQRLAASAAALAHGVVLLAGWLWLGLQGMRLGWSLAGGVGVVALWWALVLLCSRWAPWMPGLQRRAWGPGLATGAGVLLVQAGGLGTAGLPVLLATALAWALWAEALTPCAPPPHRHLNGEPVGAAGSPDAGLTPPPRTHGLGSEPLGTLAARALPATAMGLMMGTLWLSSQWCATAGWPAPAWVALHVALMTLLPVLLGPAAQALQAHPIGREALPLGLLALGGACVLASASPTGWMLGMALQAVAASIGRASPCVLATRTNGLPLTGALALGGPLLLALVGTLSATAGPQALHLAQAGLGALALLALLPLLWRRIRATPPWSPPPSTRVHTP